MGDNVFSSIFKKKLGRGETLLAGKQQHCKARERKTKIQTKFKNNVSSTAVLNDDNNAFDIGPNFTFC